MARRKSFTVIVDGRSEATVFSFAIAKHLARDVFQQSKSVIIRNNATRKTMARFIYGHEQ